jgi:hypothetical protein
MWCQQPFFDQARQIFKLRFIILILGAHLLLEAITV